MTPHRAKQVTRWIWLAGLIVSTAIVWAVAS